jgi:hypothetical protein
MPHDNGSDAIHEVRQAMAYRRIVRQRRTRLIHQLGVTSACVGFFFLACVVGAGLGAAIVVWRSSR